MGNSYIYFPPNTTVSCIQQDSWESSAFQEAVHNTAEHQQLLPFRNELAPGRNDDKIEAVESAQLSGRQNVEPKQDETANVKSLEQIEVRAYFRY